MGIWKTSLGGKFSQSLCGLPLRFQRSKLDNVELKGGEMETLLLILQFLIILGLIAAGYVLKDFLPGYSRENGKNLATKEDIGEITRKVESAKLGFSAQIERLKTDLNADMRRQLNIFAKRNEALTQFFEDSFTVLTLLRSGFHFRYEDVDGLDKLIMETQARIIRAITSNYRLMLYVQEESILTPARDAQTAIKTLYGTWWDLVQNFRIAFLAEAKEWERAITTGDASYFAGDINDRLSVQAYSKLERVTGGTLNTLERSLQEYVNALYAQIHSVDKSEGLTATNGT
jgi:hypothetical protein